MSNILVTNAIKDAVTWLAHSGIQAANADPRTNGAVAAWFDPDTAHYSYWYPEITGYAATIWAWLGQTNAAQFEHGAAAVRWLIEVGGHQPSGLYGQKWSLDMQTHTPIAYTFDQGIILSGVLNMFRATNHTPYRDHAERLADALLAAALQPNGALKPYVLLTEHAHISETEQGRWSRQTGPYLSKCVLGLLQLVQISDDLRWRETSRQICDWALRFQRDDHTFVVNPHSGASHAHPLNYTGEAMVAAGLVLDDERYRRAACAIACGLLSAFEQYGYLPRIFVGTQAIIQPERVDVLAQSLRLGGLCVRYGWLDGARWQNTLDQMAMHLLSFQVHTADQRQHGGFRFGNTAYGVPSRHVNSWCTMFALQALILYADAALFDPLQIV